LDTGILWIAKVGSFADMKKILNIISSPRGAESYSIQLAETLIDKLRAQYPGSTVKTVDLVKAQFPHLEEAQLAGFFTPPDQHEERHRSAVHHSDEAIGEVFGADIIIVGAPMYNFGVPSALKAWIDHIVRAGKTFSYSEKGAAALVNGKKAYLVIASGGVYSEGPMKEHDFVEPYLRWILGFIGLTDITTVRVEGLAIPGLKETALEKAIAGIHLN
jgi:FMN-dependent NADH-azoreductase